MPYRPVTLARIAAAQCIVCGIALLPEVTGMRCAACLAINVSDQRRKTVRRRAKGQCLECQEPAVLNRLRCAIHLARHRKSIYAKRDERALQGFCPHCPHPTMTTLLNACLGHRLCQTCYLKRAARVRLGSSKLWEVLYDKLIRQGYRCAYSGERLELGRNDALDHMFPTSRFPELAHDPANVEWITRRMNHMKNARTPDEFMRLFRQVVNYHDHGLVPEEGVA